MARRKNQRRRPMKAEMMPWEDWCDRLFRLKSSDWTRPDRIQMRATLKGGTYVAVYRDEEGRAVRLTTRVAVNWTTNEVRILDERMSITLVGGRS